MLVIEPFAINISPLAKNYTLQEFFELPEPKDNSKMEMINGVIYMSPMPDWNHTEIISRLIELLQKELNAERLKGKIFVPRAGIQTGKNTWVEPDLYFLSDTNLAKLNNKHPSTADLVIEVLSFSTEEYDRTTKADTYEILKVRELWLINPKEKTVEVRENPDAASKWNRIILYEKQDLIVSKIVPSLKFSIEKLF